MKIIVYLIGACLFCSCEEAINLDLPNRNPRIVVDGLITNEDTSYYVKLTNTTKYTYTNSSSTNTFEQSALVTVTDNLRNVDTLEEISPGIYKTHVTKFKGVIGRSYQLDIFTQAGKHLQSNMEEMLDVPKIDSIYFERNVSDRSPTNPSAYLFDIYIDWMDPSNVTNYYLRNISYYWSKQWQDNEQWNSVFSDKYFNGKSLKKDLVTESYGGYNWLLRINQFSLTQKAYKFWNLVHQQTAQVNNDFSNSSVPLIGNVYNVDSPDDYALGYFQVSAKTTAEILIDK